ncbi:C40 family peptidase, partial [Bacillus mycoides]|nr:C40 family peptidase [Bacillus mycoides]
MSINALVEFAKKQYGKPYVFGTQGPNTFDCSGFIYYVLKNNGYSISRQSVAGYWNSGLTERTSTPRAGDLIYFQNTYTSGPSHMGIMINTTEFIHAADEKTGVTITSINNSYFKSHFLGYGRLPGSEPEEPTWTNAYNPTDGSIGVCWNKYGEGAGVNIYSQPRRSDETYKGVISDTIKYRVFGEVNGFYGIGKDIYIQTEHVNFTPYVAVVTPVGGVNTYKGAIRSSDNYMQTLEPSTKWVALAYR